MEKASAAASLRTVLASFIMAHAGHKTAAVVKIKDFERLLAAYEEVADARDFAAANGSAKGFLSAADPQKALATKRQK